MPRYSKKLLDHFNNPRNVGVMEDADAIGQERNEACGDTITLYLKIRDGAIIDVKFQALGCGASIAASSATTELLMGRSLDEARALNRRHVADALGGLPPAKLHSSVLPIDTLKAALRDHDRKRSDTIEESTSQAFRGGQDSLGS